MKDNLVSATSDHQVLVNNVVYRQVLTQFPVKQKDKDPNAPQKIEITRTRSIGDKTITEKKLIIDGKEAETTSDTKLNQDEVREFEQKWSEHWKPILSDDSFPVGADQKLNLK
jgi:hypothetical protein